MKDKLPNIVRDLKESLMQTKWLSESFILGKFGGGGEIRAEYEKREVMVRLKSRGRILQAREGFTKQSEAVASKFSASDPSDLLAVITPPVRVTKRTG